MYLDSRIKWVVETLGPVTRVKGVATPGAVTTRQIRGSQAQPSQGDEMQFSERGNRTGGTWTVFTKSKVKTLDQNAATVGDFMYEADIPEVRYRVTHVQIWKKRGGVSHFRLTLVNVRRPVDDV